MKVESESFQNRDQLISIQRSLNKELPWDQRKLESDLGWSFPKDNFWKAHREHPSKDRVTIESGIDGVPLSFLFCRKPWKVTHEKRRTTTGFITRTRTRTATAHRVCTPAPVVARTAATTCSNRSSTRIIGRFTFTSRSPTRFRILSPKDQSPPRRRRC